MTAIIGNDGAITLPSAHQGVINQWQANATSVVSETTGFANNSNRTNRLGLLAIDGTATGLPQVSSPGPGASAIASGGAVLVLTIATACTWTFTAAFSGIRLTSNKVGDALLVFDFVNGDADDFAEVWDEA